MNIAIAIRISKINDIGRIVTKSTSYRILETENGSYKAKELSLKHHLFGSSISLNEVS